MTLEVDAVRTDPFRRAVYLMICEPCTSPVCTSPTLFGQLGISTMLSRQRYLPTRTEYLALGLVWY